MLNGRLLKNFYTCINKRNISIMPKSKNKNTPQEGAKVAPSRNGPNQTSSQAPLQKNDVKFEILPTPVKSASDLKEYRVLRLENGLTCCLVSDKTPISLSEDEDTDTETEDEEEEETEEESEAETVDSSDDEMEGDEKHKYKEPEHKMAAAALCVGVGSFSDPKDIQGMAHFLEHMVFMGSEKYPEENDFDSFITKRGGSNNASTDCEYTTFYLECFEKHLHTSLDKFAQFFIAPLMERESMTREREAIDSEFQQAVPSDMYRKEQLLLNLAKKDCPVNTFTWGNLKTLRDNIADDKLYEAVHEFRKRHYSAHRMTFALQARLPLDTLQSYVLELFSAVPCNNLPADDFKMYENVYDTPEFAKFYYILPGSDVIQAELTWILPSLLNKYKSKPHQYVSWILGDEGEGSLLTCLRKKSWALNMSTGNDESGSENNSLYTSFTVTITLTEAGYDHLNQVIELVFSYINMLKKLGPQKRIYDEIKTIEDVSFRFAVEEPAADFVEELVENMQIYPSEHYMTGSDLYFEYDPDGIKMVLDHLVPTKMNVMVLSNSLKEGDFDQTEPWFGTKYSVSDFPKEWLEKWEKAEPLDEFAIPPPNKFLTTDFSLIPEIKDQPLYPVKIFDDDLGELWYRQDQKFKLPLAYYYFNLINPTVLTCAKSLAIMDCLVSIFGILVIEDAYPAQVAELSYRFNTNDKGIIFKVFGYNEKLPMLIELLTKHLKNFNSHLKENTFNAVKEALQKNYYNNVLSPKSLAKEIRLNILIDNFHPTIDKLNAIESVTFEDIQEFSVKFIKNLYVKLLVQGNVQENVARKVFKDFLANLECQPISKEEYPKYRVGQVPNGEAFIKFPSMNVNDTNSIITNYYQAGPFSLFDSVIIEIIMLIISEPLFDTLRTKEQLGYEVSCSHRDTYGILGFTITVHAQVTKNSTNHVDTRIENFVKQVSKILKDMSQDDFKESITDLIKLKQCVDVRLKDEVSRNWSEIVEDDYIFDRIPQEIKALEQLKLKDLRNWWSEHTSKDDSSKFRKLGIQVVGSDKKEAVSCKVGQEGESLKLVLIKDDDNQIGKKFVENIQDFKGELYLHPVVVLKSCLE